ncbi:hypothetical protein GQ54DRAFT_295171 [Martensiomyces pterosporus]|nr:hypothetical protein GQ54DRAFT_295171 [Martensiomyces pterosporus]
MATALNAFLSWLTKAASYTFVPLSTCVSSLSSSPLIWAGAAVTGICLASVLCGIVIITKRARGGGARRRSRAGGLGIHHPISSPTRGRRCHSSSALLFSESTPLLMERGQEFFATPKEYHSGPKKAGGGVGTRQKARAQRRIYTEPTISILETLPELDSDIESHDDPVLRAANQTGRQAPQGTGTPRVSVASTVCGDVLPAPSTATGGNAKHSSERQTFPTAWTDSADTWTICDMPR